MKSIFYPVNFEIHNLAKKLITPARILTALGVFALNLLVTFAYTVRNFFINAETRNILGGIVVLAFTWYLTYLVVSKICLREKLLMRYYNEVRNFQNRPVYDLINIVDVDKSNNGIPIFICSTGMRIMGLKVYPDSIVGRSSPSQVNEHYNVSKNLFGQLALNFKTCWCLYLTSSHGNDKRWEELIRVNVSNPCPVIKRIINSMIVHSQRIRDNQVNEYYLVMESMNTRPASRMVEALTECATWGREGYNAGCEFIDEAHMTEILEQIFTTDKTFNDLNTSLDREDKQEIKHVRLVKIINTDGTEINMDRPQGGTKK